MRTSERRSCVRAAAAGLVAAVVALERMGSSTPCTWQEHAGWVLLLCACAAPRRADCSLVVVVLHASWWMGTSRLATRPACHHSLCAGWDFPTEAVHAEPPVSALQSPIHSHLPAYLRRLGAAPAPPALRPCAWPRPCKRGLCRCWSRKIRTHSAAVHRQMTPLLLCYCGLLWQAWA